MPAKPQPWSQGDATSFINDIAKRDNCRLSYKLHATQRLSERGLIMSDVLFVLRNGFVYELPEPSTIDGFFKYKVESKSPNSGSRSLRVVVVPEETSSQLKIITVMWRDE